MPSRLRVEARNGWACARHIALALLAAGACFPWASHAQSTTVNGTVALSSQLVDRGQAVTEQTPVLQGAVSVGFGTGWSLGASASVETRSPDHVVEGLLQGSRAWSLSPDWQMQANLVYYDYPNDPHVRTFDRTEAGLSWTYRDVLTLSASAIYPVGKVDHTLHGAGDISFRWPLPLHFSFSAGAGITQSTYTGYRYVHSAEYGHGYVAYDQATTYRYGHAGLAWSYGAWRAEVDRIVTSGLPPRYGYPETAPWVATVSWSF